MIMRSGWVYCDCWRAGRLGALPFPREWVKVDPESGGTWVENPAWPHPPADGTPAREALDDAFEALRRACPHGFNDETLANVDGLDGLAMRLKANGAPHLPHLMALLEDPGPYTSPAVAESALPELTVAEATLVEERGLAIVDADTGETLAGPLPPELHQQLYLPLDHERILYLEGRELVLKRHFRVVEVRRFTARDVRLRTRKVEELGRGPGITAGRRFRVEERPHRPYADLVSSLRSLCLESVRFQNPIVW